MSVRIAAKQRDARWNGRSPAGRDGLVGEAMSRLAAKEEFAGFVLSGVETLAGDASQRRYRRLRLCGPSGPVSFVLMELAGGYGPVHGGPEGPDQDDRFFLLSQFFHRAGVPVPRVLLDGRDSGFLVVEDMGDLALWRLVTGIGRTDGGRACAGGRPSIPGDVDERDDGDFTEQVSHAFEHAPGSGDAGFGGESIPSLTRVYEKLVDVIIRIQSCRPCDKPFDFVFGRMLGFDEYRLEARRFFENEKIRRRLDRRGVSKVERLIDEVAGAVASHSKVLIHRDFMPWNIHILPGGEVAVLDFQDASVGSYVYDIVSLLHDRDIDFALGDVVCAAVAGMYQSRRGADGMFVEHYLQALVQRNLRLAGQFETLAATKGCDRYGRWASGCLVRLGRALAALPEHRYALDALADVSEELRMGAREPFPLRSLRRFDWR